MLSILLLLVEVLVEAAPLAAAALVDIDQALAENNRAD
jgi:hypothetical protein